MKLTITNDFHNTEAVVIVRDGGLTKSQVRRAKRKLCGMADCTCSDFIGRRGEQPIPDPENPEFVAIIQETEVGFNRFAKDNDVVAEVWLENPHW